MTVDRIMTELKDLHILAIKDEASKMIDQEKAAILEALNEVPAHWDTLDVRAFIARRFQALVPSGTVAWSISRRMQFHEDCKNL